MTRGLYKVCDKIRDSYVLNYSVLERSFERVREPPHRIGDDDEGVPG